MTTTDPTGFIEVLEKNHLLTSGQLRAIREESRVASTEGLADELIGKGWLTSYQSQEAVEGRAESLILGSYIIQEPLGEGGMGQIFKARHKVLNRMAAIKVIRDRQMGQGSEAVRRFLREARAAAKLSHPHIVIIYDSDCVEDTYFIAMELLDGVDLAQMIKAQGPFALDHACNIIRQAALGLEHIYQNDMVHRDIKPSNLFVTTQHSTNDKTVKILDLGLVRLGADMSQPNYSLSLTQEGLMIGTPDYIAPEQARDSRQADIRSDLYSLGCTFYHLLTGSAPFPAGSVIEKLLQHQLDEPTALEVLRPNISPAVAEIVRKLMTKTPEDRYQTPQELIDVLDQLAIPASAEEIGPLPEKPITDEEKVASTCRTENTPDPSPREDIQITPSDLVSASVYHWAATSKSDEQTEEGPEQVKLIFKLKGHANCITSLAFTSDRHTLASGDVAGKIRIWDFRAKNPQRAVLTTQSDTCHALAFNASGTLLASGSGGMDGLIWLWDVQDDQPKLVGVCRGHKGPVDVLAFAPNDALLASGGTDGTVRLWDMAEPHLGRSKDALKGHESPVKSLVFSPDSHFVASGGMDGTIRHWNIDSRSWFKQRTVRKGHRSQVSSLAYSPDGKLLASKSPDQSTRLWEITPTSLEENMSFATPSNTICDLVFKPDGATLVASGDGQQIHEWDVASGAMTREWLVPRFLVTAMSFTTDARYLALASRDRVLIFRLGEKRRPAKAEAAGEMQAMPKTKPDL